ncbi:YggS family pyridoxal phosphate-dependent enzyme [Eoetvoesiella caeni]|uniref:Pyridoxal phosphate homeostasis protein n=1 Tax=Eoetvoesiella caeni TaxID=645616 RepID=A0A366H8E1_9BURK|nr:YggS family pyridoxal phosphate-dependent enzyme [Eoetvoesiella caeni]MCI2809796.1 YggS family pyridoxal phosphate-dependent enzyme [Eoetvoesiella caeni]NYT56289.1 YggS family pyridoxal phosphate-dependent enzyme [Eoetvoesiella caeni]RBP38347.1 hypothetical protein DFR37_107111 [Eoetvoesiella caeni]
MPESLENRLASIQQKITAACAKAHRDPDTVALLPVTKTFDAEVVRGAASLGLRRFGENKTQEIRQKFEALSDLNLQWVLIGHLQTNKARDAARFASEVQSLDRLSLAQALDARLQAEGRALDVLVQVKTSDEPSKFGLEPAELPVFLKQLASLDTLRVKGLMTLAVNSPDAQAVRACFRSLREWRDRLRNEGFEQVQRLSMGMSGDFELAIEEGSNEVRIGSAIFGRRDYSH